MKPRKREPLPAEQGLRRGQAPVTAKGRATRQRILVAAEREITNKGFDRASVGLITMRARIGVGTFYLYFSSKEDVLCTLVRNLGRQLGDRLSTCGARDGAPADVQRLRLQAYLQFRAAHPGLDRIVNAAEWVDGRIYREYYANLARELQLERQADAPAGDNGGPPKPKSFGVDHFLRLWQAIARPSQPMAPALDASRAAAVAG